MTSNQRTSKICRYSNGPGQWGCWFVGSTVIRLVIEEDTIRSHHMSKECGIFLVNMSRLAQIVTLRSRDHRLSFLLVCVQIHSCEWSWRVYTRIKPLQGRVVADHRRRSVRWLVSKTVHQNLLSRFYRYFFF